MGKTWGFVSLLVSLSIFMFGCASVALGIGSTMKREKDGMLMVYVPAGTFTMGSAGKLEVFSEAAQMECQSWSVPEFGDCKTFDFLYDERPSHTVTLDAYWIDKTEVTNAMFQTFVKATGYRTDAEKAGSSLVFNLPQQVHLPIVGANWHHPKGPNSSLDGLSEYPVVNITWSDANAYCTWAGGRLPSEAEWEKAARGTDGRTYPWGEAKLAGELANIADMNLAVGWTDKNINDCYPFIAPVGSYPDGASPYGALDMAGNVAEWVNDYYGDTYYRSSPPNNPIGPTGDSSQNVRVQRGGSCLDADSFQRTSMRFGEPAMTALDIVGTRCALSVTP